MIAFPWHRAGGLQPVPGAVVLGIVEAVHVQDQAVAWVKRSEARVRPWDGGIHQLADWVKQLTNQ